MWTADCGTACRSLTPFCGSPVCNSTMHAQRLKPLKVPEMLFRQKFRRRHERHIETALQRHQSRARGHDGFARPNVPLQQPPHRVRAVRSAGFRAARGLRRVSLKSERARNGLIRRLSPPHGNAARFGLEVSPAQLRSAHCNATNSSRASRRRAISTSVSSSGKMNHANVRWRATEKTFKSNAGVGFDDLRLKSSSVRQINPRNQRCGRPSVSG